MTLVDKILELKKKKNAIILAHYYVNEDIQKIADFVGDSFYLSKIALNTDARIIVFAGVKFMGESAKLLNYDKKVLLVNNEALCPMAEMASINKIKQLRKEYDDLKVVCYINSTLELKKESDVCVTSSNALKIVSSLNSKNIYFIPDQNLGRYVKENIKDKNIILNDGYCPIHNRLSIDNLLKLKAKYPKATVLAHPECQKEILVNSDVVGSTAYLIEAVKTIKNDEFIVLTEEGILYELKKRYPNYRFYEPDYRMLCGDMKKNTLVELYDTLLEEKNEVIINSLDRIKALKPLEEMLKYAK